MPELVSGDLWVPDSARYQPERAHGGRPGNEVAVYDSTGVVVMNHTDQSTDYLMGEVARQSPEIASLVQWTRGVRSRHGSILDRDRYVTPTFVWDVFRAADYAVKNDDVVGGVYETTEALAFSKITVETDDDDECVDPETEILTIDGWKTHDQLHVGDLILTLNRETGFSEWKPVDFVFRKAYRGPMHSFQGRNFDALTTPEHRWYVKGTRGQQLRVVYSKDLNSGHRVPYARPCVNAPDCDPGISDDLVRVAGWLVTDGWYQPRHHHQWWISQSATANAANCLLIERALDALGAEWVLERTSADGVRHYKCGGAPADTLHKLLPDALLTMDFVRVLSPEQRYLLMETMIAGDGNAKGSSCSFTTTDAQQAEAFEFLVAQCGRATTRTIIPPGKVSFIGGRTVTSRRPKYVIHVMANRHAKVECLTHEIVEYDGVIWCPHTENGSFLARRNGHIYFTGNTDIWNQILGDIDLDARIREMWLAMYTFSQFYCASYWGQKTYKVESRIQAADEKDKNRRARRKTYDLKVPLGLSILDPTKVVPVGNLLFNQDQLAYAAMVPEIDVINATINGLRDSDPIIRQLLVAPWEPDIVERTQLGHMGLPADRLYLMNRNRVFRHTDTRLQYDRFAPVRLQAVFELLDMKAQLRQMDRAVLLASTNFLVVVKRGSKEQPATPGEIADTDSKFRTMARVPVIVADHRFEVEIVTPKNDQTLNPDRYDNIDNRITIRLLSLFITNKQQAAARSDDSIKLARVIGRSLESKRYMLRRAIERRVLHPIWEANEMLREKPRLRFHPQHIALDLDPALLNFILDMRDRGDVSRGTMLEQIDLDEEAEARKVEREHEIYDDIFQTVIPGAALPQNTGGQQEPPGAGNTSQPSRSGKLAQHRAEPKKPGQLVQAPTDPKAAGRRQGGAKNGGGVGRRGRGAGPNAKEGGSEDSEA